MTTSIFSRIRTAVTSTAILSTIGLGATLAVPAAAPAASSRVESKSFDLTSVAPALHGGYWVQSAARGTVGFGGADPFGGVRGEGTIVANPAGQGYWVVTGAGDIYARGNAPFLCGGKLSNCTGFNGGKIVGAAATATGGGLYALTSDGRVYAAGDATYAGDPSQDLGWTTATGIAATPGGGYYVVDEDGHVFRFGSDAPDHGSFDGRSEAKITGIAVHTKTNDTGLRYAAGYWLVGETGGVHAFGGAPFRGSGGGNQRNITGIAATPDGQRYLWIDTSGNVTSSS